MLSMLETPAVELQPVRIGAPGRSLFGVLHQPVTSTPKLCVIMLNAGMQNRAGPQRLYWKFAQKAATGWCAVLRVDLSGVGDCDMDNAASHFDAHNKAEVAMTVTFMRERFPDSRIVLLGLCAGSRVAFKAAADDPDIDGLIAWSTTIVTAAQNSPQSPDEPEDRMSEIVVSQGVGGIFRFFTRLRFLNPFWWRKKFPNFQGISDEIRHRSKVLKYLVLGIDTSRTRNEFLDAVKKYLEERRKVLFIYGDRDLRVLQEFKERFPQVPEADAGLQRLHTVENGTHTFSSVAAQVDVIARTCAWLDEYYQIFKVLPPGQGTKPTL